MVTRAMQTFVRITLTLAFIVSCTAAFADDEDNCQQSQDAGKSLKACTRLIKRDTGLFAFNENKNLSKWFAWRSMAHLNKNDQAQALSDANEALKLDPANAVAYDARANYNFGTSNFDSCIADATVSIGLDSTDAFAFNIRALCYYRKHDLDHALSDANATISADRSSARHYLNRAMIYKDKQKFKEAAADAKTALAKRPNAEEKQEANALLAEVDKVSATITSVIAICRKRPNPGTWGKIKCRVGDDTQCKPVDASAEGKGSSFENAKKNAIRACELEAGTSGCCSAVACEAEGSAWRWDRATSKWVKLDDTGRCLTVVLDSEGRVFVAASTDRHQSMGTAVSRCKENDSNQQCEPVFVTLHCLE
jgi:tetratricopeptide (TPR) repeat protein